MELGVDFIIRPLNVADLVSKFSSGNPESQPLKSFLQNQAKDFHESGIAKTYVVVALEKCEKTGLLVECSKRRVLGYISLITSEIDITNGYSVEDCPYANNYGTLPAIKIARLAVDSKFRRCGIGDSLVAFAFAISTDIVAAHVGCRFLITDAKQDAIPFYEKQGFTLLDTDANKSVEAPIMFVDLFKLS